MNSQALPIGQAFSPGNISRSFLDYYAPAGYRAIPGSSLLDPSVPMSFVMSAGLVQVERSVGQRDSGKERCFTLLQNCFRYFDLSTVGKSDIHLSLFQMAGAFTFGPMSQRDSILQTWQLLTEVYGFPPEALWVTYFAEGIIAGYYFGPDTETYAAWQEVGLPPERIIGLGRKDNFWKQGASVVGEEHVAKCGPNTEVFFDRGADLQCSPTCKPGCQCGRFVELVNTLFITLHIDEQADVVKPLENPFTETVIGVERAAMVLQRKSSVFEIDPLSLLIDHIRKFVDEANLCLDDCLIYERVLADHVRALLFLVADGAPPPGKGGRARLMRKLTRNIFVSQKMLGIPNDTLIPSLVDITIKFHASQHPQLPAGRSKLLAYLNYEHQRFERTIKSGYRQLNYILNRRQNKAISGDDILTLEKEHGFPLPLLKSVLKQRQIRFSHQAYQMAHDRWRDMVVGN